MFFGNIDFVEWLNEEFSQPIVKKGPVFYVVA